MRRKTVSLYYAPECALCGAPSVVRGSFQFVTTDQKGEGKSLHTIICAPCAGSIARWHERFVLAKALGHLKKRRATREQGGSDAG